MGLVSIFLWSETTIEAIIKIKDDKHIQGLV